MTALETSPKALTNDGVPLGRTFAVHQPNYLPWLGYFAKMAASDVFVLLDTVQFPRGRSFSVRNRIKTSNGVVYLTVPVSVPKGSDGRVGYAEVRTADQKWKTKHAKTIEHAYKKAPFFDDVFALYSDAVAGVEGDSLVELNVALLEAIVDYLDINTKLVRQSELAIDAGSKSQLIVDIGATVGGDIYLSGTGGGRDYNDEDLFDENDVVLRYSTYQPATYAQLWGSFEPNLSVIDALFNCGPAAADFLEA